MSEDWDCGSKSEFESSAKQAQSLKERINAVIKEMKSTPLSAFMGSDYTLLVRLDAYKRGIQNEFLEKDLETLEKRIREWKEHQNMILRLCI